MVTRKERSPPILALFQGLYLTSSLVDHTEEKILPSKYDQFMKDLPRLLTATSEDDPTWQDKIDRAKAAIVKELGGATSTLLAAGYRKCRLVKDALTEQLKLVNVEEEAYKQMIAEAYENDGITSLTLGSGEKVRVQPEPYAQVADRDLFRRWCATPSSERFSYRERQEDGTVADVEVQGGGLAESMAIAWGTTNALLKERMLVGEEPPPGVKPFVKVGLRLQKA